MSSKKDEEMVARAKAIVANICKNSDQLMSRDRRGSLISEILRQTEDQFSRSENEVQDLLRERRKAYQLTLKKLNL